MEICCTQHATARTHLSGMICVVFCPIRTGSVACVWVFKRQWVGGFLEINIQWKQISIAKGSLSELETKLGCGLVV